MPILFSGCKCKPLSLWLLVSCVIMTMLNLSCTDSSSPVKASFADLFVFENRVSVTGDSVSPLYSLSSLTITRGKILHTDFMGHAVNIFKLKSGELLARLGKQKGQGPGEFQNPYTAALDKKGFLYINDRGNNRIQVFDPSYSLVQSFPIMSQCEKILVRNSDSGTRILMMNVAPFKAEDGNSYLIREYDQVGVITNVLGQFNRSYSSNSWAVTLDPQQRIYIANVLETEVSVYNTQGKFEKVIKISSPTIIPLPFDIHVEPQSWAELKAQQKAFQEEVHTKIQDFVINNRFIFVSHLLRNQGNDEKYLLDIFDHTGNLLYYGIELPGRLLGQEDKFFIIKKDEKNDYGGGEIVTYSLNIKLKSF